MAFSSSGQSLRDLHDPNESAHFLSMIESAHAHFELCSGALESIMVEDKCVDMTQFGAVRLRLAHANLTRTRVAREACSHLISIIPADGAEALRDLEQCEIEHFQMISKHIQRWPTQAVQDNWHGYCGATRKLLERTRELIAIEKKLLLPLLRQPH